MDSSCTCPIILIYISTCTTLIWPVLPGKTDPTVFMGKGMQNKEEERRCSETKSLSQKDEGSRFPLGVGTKAPSRCTVGTPVASFAYAAISSGVRTHSLGLCPTQR